MTRMCFMRDDDGHWYAIEFDRRGFFNDLLDKSIRDEDYEEFENEFGDGRLGSHISRYSFEDLREE